MNSNEYPHDEDPQIDTLVRRAVLSRSAGVEASEPPQLTAAPRIGRVVGACGAALVVLVAGVLLLSSLLGGGEEGGEQVAITDDRGAESTAEIRGVLADGRSFRLTDSPEDPLCTTVGDTFVGCSDTGLDPHRRAGPVVSGDTQLPYALITGRLATGALSAQLWVEGRPGGLAEESYLDDTGRLYAFALDVDLEPGEAIEAEVIHLDGDGTELRRENIRLQRPG